jgi:hypothetical protein
MQQRLHLVFSRRRLLYLLLFVVAFVVYWATGEGHPTYFNYYVRLADAFLHGRLYLLENPSWLNELIPFAGGFYVVYPPLPAFIMTPLVALFGVNLNQTLISLFFGGFCVAIANSVARDIGKTQSKEGANHEGTYLWATVLFGFGTIFWWLASVGSVWLIAQVIATFFMFLAIHEAFNKARPLLIGLLVGASYWCRLPTILGIFFFAGLIVSRQSSEKWKTKARAALPSLIKLAAGAGIFVLFDMLYNVVRFGTPFDAGYWLIPGVQNEPWFSQGMFSLSYIPVNLTPFLTGLPVFTLNPLSVVIPMTGLAIWFTTPAFIFALKSKVKDPVTWWSWIAIVSIALVIFTRGLSGWGFGYRYAVDFYPFLYVLTVKGIGGKVKWYHKLLIIIGVLVNLFGTIAVNKLGLLG